MMMITTRRLLLCSNINKHINQSTPFYLTRRNFFWSKSKEPVQQQQQQQQQHVISGAANAGTNTVGVATRTPSSTTKTITDKITLPNIKHIITICSAKGGVGKSTVSTNVALALAHFHNQSVGLLDADIHGPSLHRMMGIKTREKQINTETNMLIPSSNYGVRVMSMGMIVPEDSAAIWRGPMVMGALNQLLTQTEWGELDFLVIDLPPGTGDAQLTLCQRMKLDGAIIVSTPQDIALIDARRGINMFRKVEVPILGIIENMSYHICSNCGHEEHIFGHGGAEQCAVDMGIPFMGNIPLHIDIRERSDIGAPIVVSQPQSEHSKKFYAIAEKILQVVNVGNSNKSGSLSNSGPEIIIEQ